MMEFYRIYYIQVWTKTKRCPWQLVWLGSSSTPNRISSGWIAMTMRDPTEKNFPKVMSSEAKRVKVKQTRAWAAVPDFRIDVRVSNVWVSECQRDHSNLFVARQHTKAPDLLLSAAPTEILDTLNLNADTQSRRRRPESAASAPLPLFTVGRLDKCSSLWRSPECGAPAALRGPGR